MDYKPIFEQFKDEYVGTDVFSFSLFPILFLELRKYGATQEIITNDFMEFFRNFFLLNEKPGVHIKAIEYLGHYMTTLPAGQIVKTPEKPKIEAKIEKKEEMVVPQVSYSNIPTEEEEGDGLSIPEHEQIHLKPEDCAKAELDVEFLDLIGATRFKR